MADILADIVARKRHDLASAMARTSEATLDAMMQKLERKPHGFESALRGGGLPRVIAEVKKASPSAGLIRADFDPVHIAQTYAAHGATCLSILTDEPFFQGHLDYLKVVRQAVSLPLLRKEFILERYQLLEAVLAGADAVLLIAEILPGEELARLFRQARELGLDVLVELHDADQLSRVLDCGATLVGVNNRNLRTFETRLEHTLELLGAIPSNVAVVSESGIKSHADLLRLGKAGVQAVLVGESLMRSPDIGSALTQLLGSNSTGNG
jgi:indole-3-glycerol phosphate synthase